MAESVHLKDSNPSSTATGATVASPRKAAQQASVSGFTSFAHRRNDVIQQEEIEEILKLTAQEISKQTTSNSSMLVQLANNPDSKEKLKELLPIYFYSWNLTDPHSIIVYLLLHFFLVKRDHDEIVNDKRLYEDHIARLKTRMSDLEERLTKSSLALATASAAGGTRVQSQQNLGEVFRLQRQVEQLMKENEQLRRTSEEICRINEQWALDYAQLSDQISNATGFYSNSSTGTHSQNSTSQFKNSKSNHASPSPRPGSTSPTLCTACIEKDNRLENSEGDIAKLEYGMESLKCELRETRDKLRQREKMIERLENDHQAIILQLQELGDLQQALRVKQEYRKLQHQYTQVRRQQQDTMCEKLHLQKQVEKLRQAFLSLFPFAQAHHAPSVDSTPGSGYGYNSFPMRTCRRHFQQYPHSDPPPTPPGLIARGDHHGSLVEKDEDHTSSLPGHHKYEEQVTGFEKPSKSLGPCDLLHSQQYSNKSTPTIPSGFGHASLNTSGQFLNAPSISRTVMPSQTGYSSSFSFSMPNAGVAGQNEKSMSSRLHTSTVPPSTLPLPTSSHPHKSHTVTSVSLSSGYASPSPFNHVTPSSESGSSTGTTQSLKHDDHSADVELTKSGQTSFSSLSTSGKSRPKELFELSGSVDRHGDTLYCSNCKKQFKYSRQSFDSWFEHVRFCDK